MVLPDVELTVAARDDTGQALNHVHARLLDINATVERQTAIMQRTEKEYARFADQVQLSGANAMGTFKDMHTMLGKINEALRDNQKAQKEVNKETSKASMGGGADSGSMQYMKKVSDADVTSRAELRKIANRAAITQEEAYQNSLLQKQRDGTQQYLSGLKSANDEKDTESQKNNKRRLGKHQETLDEEYVSQKTFQDKSMQELVAHENLTGDHHAQSGKRELQLHKQATKDSVAEVKEKHDKILQQRKVSDNEQSAIRKQSLDADIAEAKQANEKDEREGTAHTDRLISNRKTHHEKELVNNQEFRSKALALLENEQAKEILMIDESDVIALVHAKESHIAQIAELTDHLNQKDSALEDEFNKETLMHKASGERLLGVDKEILGERLAHIKEQHGIVESEAKVHEAKLLQIRKHSRRTEISKVQYEGDVGTEGISQRLRAESTQRKQLEEEQIRDSKIRAKTLKEISDIELEETLANQKISHNQQLAESKNFTDEKIEDMKRAAAESTAIAKQESVEKSRIQKQSAQEQQSIRDRQNDKRLDQLKKSQADEMESLKAIGDKKLDRRERRNKKEMDTMLDYREREKNETEKLLDEGIMNMKRGIERKEALMEREAQNAVTARNKQADDEIRAMTRQKKKEISIIKSSLEKLEVEYKRDRRIALMNLNAKHEKEIGAIDSHEKVKIALAQESQAKEKQDAISYYDELYGIERSALEEKEALLENKLRVERATKEVGRDKDIASVKAHGERINDEEKANHRQSLSQLESYGRKRLAEIDHMTEMEAEKLRQAQRKMSRKISDSIKGSKFGKALGKVDRGITGFLAADFAMIGVREVFDFVKGLGQALIKMEAMKLSLTAVEGSAEKAYVQLARIVDIAKKPGVHLESAIKTTVTLRALKLEGDLVEKTIVNIGNALATLGREQELGGVTLALSQIIGKGKVHAEEINQIAERLPLIRGVLVEQFGTANTEILQKMDISITDFVAKITEGLGNLPKVATTIGTEFKNMQNQWFLFKTSLGTLIKPGLMTSIRGFTKLLELGNNFLDKLNKGGKEDTIARDKLFRSMGHVEDYMTSVGKNDPLNESLKKLTAKLEQHRVELEKLKEGAPIGLTSSALALDTLIERIKLTEGGYNPNEPKHVGGESYAGITRATYDEWAKGPVIKSMKELAKYPDVVMKFYREYLSNVQELPEFLQYTFADFYTNARGQAVKIIQEMAGATADGIWGTETSAAVGVWRKEMELALLKDQTVDDKLIQLFHDKRVAFYERLATQDPEKYGKFLKGWLRRSDEVMSELEPYRDNKAQAEIPQDSRASGGSVAYANEMFMLSGNVRETITGMENISKTLAGATKKFEKMTSQQVFDTIKMLEQGKHLLGQEIALGGSRFKLNQADFKRAKESMKNIDFVISSLHTVLGSKSKADLDKQFADRQASNSDNVKILKQQEFDREVQDILGAQFLPELSNADIESVFGKATSADMKDAMARAIEGDLRSYSIQVGMAITDFQQSEFDKLTKVINRIDPNIDTYTRALNKDEIKKWKPEEKAKKQAETAVMLKEKATKIYNEKVLIYARMARSILDDQLEYEKWLSAEIEKIVEGYGLRYYNAAPGDKWEKARTDVELPTNKELQAMLRDDVFDLAGDAPKDYAQRLLQDDIDPVSRTAYQMTQEKTAGVGETSFMRSAEQQRLRDLAQEHVLTTEKLIDGEMRSIEKLAVLIAFLNRMAGSPEMQKSESAQKIYIQQREKLQRETIQTQRANAREAAQKLGKAPDILYRSVEEIDKALKEAKMWIIWYDIASRDDLAKYYISQRDKLEREKISTEKKGLQDERSSVKSGMSREMAEGITVDRMQSFYKQFEDLQTQAERLGFTDIAKSLQSDLDSTYRAEINLRQRNIRELETTLDKIGKYSMLRPDEISDISGRTRTDYGELEGTKELNDMVMRNIRDAEVERYRGQDEIEQQSWYNPPRSFQRADAEGNIEDVSFSVSDLARHPTGEEGEFSTMRRYGQDPQGRQMLQDYAKYQSDRSTPEPLPFDTKGFTLEDIANMEAYRDVMLSADRQIEDHALSTASNIISAWQGVSSQTDTMLDDVVGAVGQIAVNLTQTILNIQRSSALASSSTGLTSTLGSFAKYAGIAGIGLTAAATIYSFIDQKDESKGQRNKVSRSRPNSISRR